MSKQGNKFFTGQGLHGSPLSSGLNDIRYPENPEFRTPNINLIDGGIIPWEPGSSKNSQIQGDWPTIIFQSRSPGAFDLTPDGTKVFKVSTNLFNGGGLPAKYTMTVDAGGRFELVGDKIVVKDGSLLDHATDAFHTITIKAESQQPGENFGKGVSKEFKILVHLQCNDFEAATDLDWFNRGSIDAAPEIVVNPDGPGSVLELNSQEPQASRERGEAVIKSDFGCLTAPRFEFDVRFNTVDSDNDAAFWAGDDRLGHGVSGIDASVYVVFRNNQILWFSDAMGFNVVPGITLVANTWYTILIDNFDSGAFTYDISVDGDLKDTADFRNHNSTIVNWFTCFQSSLNTTWWNDVCGYPV